MSTELLQQVRLLDPVSGTDGIRDVLIRDGVVQAIAPHLTDIPAGTQVHNCQNLILGPGLVDLYSHSGEPGFEERETLESLGQSAIAGGFTRLAILPDTTPTLDDPATCLAVMQQWQSFPNYPQLFLWGALTQHVKGQQMTELAELGQAGVVGFADGLPLPNLTLVRRLLEYLYPLGKPVALWASHPDLVGKGVMREGSESIRFGLPGTPAIAETTALSALLEMIAAIGTPVHLMRISTARGVDLIRTAKAQGLPITASTTWMHVLLNSQAIANYDPSLRLDPPLGNPADQTALIQGLKDGVLDAIAIDHTAYTYEEKTVAFSEAPPGAIGLELALPLLWNTLVASEQWSALDLWRVLSTQPASCLQQTLGAIAPDQPAELTLFDPAAPWTVEQASLRSRSYNTPWAGQSLVGRVVRSWTP